METEQSVARHYAHGALQQAILDALSASLASTPDTSFVESQATYRKLLEAAGFAVQKERNRRDFAIEFFRRMRERAAESAGPPTLGLHILIGATSRQKVANMIGNLEQGLIAPVEVISLVR